MLIGLLSVWSSFRSRWRSRPQRGSQAGISGSLGPEVLAGSRQFSKAAVSNRAATIATCTLGMRDFAYFDVAQRNWHVAGGDYTISVGFSALDLRTTTTVTLPELRIAP